MNTNEIMQQWEDYLDGALAPAERVALEMKLAGDPAAREMRAAVERARQLRHAALESYMPDADETHDLREQFMAKLHAPAGRVGFPWRRYGAVAAMVVLTAGGFWLGRQTASSGTSGKVATGPVISAPVGTNSNKSVPTNYIVTITDPDGNVLTRNFDNITDARRYAAQWQQNVADADTPNFPGTGSL